jgi:hypothetical protein
MFYLSAAYTLGWWNCLRHVILNCIVMLNAVWWAIDRSFFFLLYLVFCSFNERPYLIKTIFPLWGWEVGLGLQMKVWYAASVFDSMHRSRLLAKAGGVLGVKPPFPKFSTCKQFHRIYSGEKSEIREYSITKLIHENKHSYGWQRARASNGIVRNRFLRTQCDIMSITSEVWVRS